AIQSRGYEPELFPSVRIRRHLSEFLVPAQFAFSYPSSAIRLFFFPSVLRRSFSATSSQLFLMSLRRFESSIFPHSGASFFNGLCFWLESYIARSGLSPTNSSLICPAPNSSFVVSILIKNKTLF